MKLFFGWLVAYKTWYKMKKVRVAFAAVLVTLLTALIYHFFWYDYYTYSILKNQKDRLESSMFTVMETVNQYHKLFCRYPADINDKTFRFLLADNLLDSLIFKLNPLIMVDSASYTFHIYLKGPDGKDDGLKKVINESYMPFKSPAIEDNFLLYLFKKGDLFLGSCTLPQGCKVKKRLFYIKGNGDLVFDDSAFRKEFYAEINRIVRDIALTHDLVPGTKNFLVYCKFDFLKSGVAYEIICTEEIDKELVDGFVAQIASHFNHGNEGISSVYFALAINESFLLR